MTYTTHADLGGQPGFGPVTPEPEGELFHGAWEPRALALTLAMGATGSWNIDTSRAARGSQAPWNSSPSGSGVTGPKPGCPPRSACVV